MRYFRALALAVLLLIGSAGPVSAAPRPPHEPINWLPCDAEGELIGIQTFRPDLHVVDYTIDLTACGSSADPFYYAMVAFGSGGWGIGLALVRRVVEDGHGGTLSLEPSERGATFLMRFPLAQGSG